MPEPIVVSISSVTPFLALNPMSGATPANRQNSPGGLMDDATLDAIREKGLSAWAHEQRMEALKEKLRAQILSDKKMSESELQGLPSEQRASVEAEIQKLIEQKLKEAMEKAVDEASKGGKTQAILIDISV